MKKIVAISGSPSSGSINTKLLNAIAGYGNESEIQVINLRDYPAPFFSIDEEQAIGAPESMKRLNEVMAQADGFIISSPEYNGMVPALFKNAVDWVSRIEKKLFRQKPVVLLSTSPGPRGGKTNLANLENIVPWWGGKVVGAYPVGSFNDVYQNGELTGEPKEVITTLVRQLETAMAENEALA